jgi:general secretion pathway protein I
MRQAQLKHSRTEAGFTLFEVVVAIALLGLILATSFGLLGMGLRSMRAAREYTRAVLLARYKLQEISLRPPGLALADDGFEGDFRWSTEVIPQESGTEDGPAQLFRLRVRVSWAAKAKEKIVEMVSLSLLVDEERLPVLSSPKNSSPTLPGGVRR